MRTISIAEFSFFDAFGRDVEMAAGIDPGENQKLRDKIDSSADTYLEIPGRSHAEHHEILQKFLKSNWTSDGEVRKRAYDAYSGSIGRWIEAVGDRNAVHSYYNFRDLKLKEMAEEFLKTHGIKALWH